MPPATTKPLGNIEHVVVLMLENRSFDNVLGWLYDPANKPPFDKVRAGKPSTEYPAKVSPIQAPTAQSLWLNRRHHQSLSRPREVYQDVYGEMYNINPAWDGTPPPPPPPAANTIPPNPPQPPPMTGFVNNYRLQPGVTQPAIS